MIVVLNRALAPPIRQRPTNITKPNPIQKCGQQTININIMSGSEDRTLTQYKVKWEQSNTKASDYNILHGERLHC